MSKRSSFDEYESESQVQKLIKKSKDSPFVPLGKVNKKVKREFCILMQFIR